MTGERRGNEWSKLLVAAALIAAVVGMWRQPPAWAAEPAQTAAPKDNPLKVLFIGNSYTFFNEMPRIVKGLALADAPDRAVDVESSVIGGATFKILWDKGDALKAIHRGGWSYVVLQGYQLPISDPDALVKYGAMFDGAIRQVGAQTVIYVTWPERQDQPQLQPRITAAYLRLATQAGAIVAPVGPAWMAAMKNDPKLNLYHSDKTHPNTRGSYLAACTIYGAISGHSPEGLAFRRVDDRDSGKPVTLDAAEAATLQKVAWEAIQSMKKPSTQPAE